MSDYDLISVRAVPIKNQELTYIVDAQFEVPAESAVDAIGWLIELLASARS